MESASLLEKLVSLLLQVLANFTCSRVSFIGIRVDLIKVEFLFLMTLEQSHINRVVVVHEEPTTSV